MQSYGPLFYVSTAAVARLSHSNVTLTVRYFRAVSYLCYLASGLMLFWICKRLGCASWLSLLATLMMLGQHDFLGWNVTVRPDMMMLLFMMMSLFFAINMDKRPWLYCLLSGTAAGLAFLFKQPGAGIAVAIVVVLLFWKEYRKAFVFSAAAALPVILMLLGLIWHKEHFLEEFTSVSKGYWSLAGGARYVWKTASQLVYIIPGAIGLLGFARAMKMGKSWQLVASFAMVSGLVALSGLPQAGSNSHYYLPTLAGCALLLPTAVQSFRTWRYLPVVSLIVIPALVSAAYSNFSRDKGYFDYFHAPEGVSYAALRPFRLISDVSLLSMKGRDPELLDAFAIHSLELAGHWDAAPVVAEIRQGKINLVVFMHLEPYITYGPHVELHRIVANWRGVSEFSPAMVDALNENYDVFCASPLAVVLKPKNRSVDISPEFFSPLFRWNCSSEAAGSPPRLMVAPEAR
ncbi:MAG TPA: glycosyltransferase family 39 protein [Terriglobales bacterium]|nr:glycosyltransferase family 39 protein [Terriglobales bacterium]